MTRTNDLDNVRRLGDFEIVREVGRGGMGVVYEARQVSLNRHVALKVLSGTLGLTSKTVQRFRREAEAAAKLHHTNIVPIYATGEQNGVYFYAMELINGPSLDHVIRNLRSERRSALPGSTAREHYDTSANSPDLQATGPYIPDSDPLALKGTLRSFSLSSGSQNFDIIAKMIADTADALDYAHRQGVIHRDIKPSNLLLSPDGRLTINDFGLARVLEQPGMTVSGELLGTPMYTSPEQITAGRVLVDHRTDVYSLGVTLYELLTLEPPFRAERRDQVLAQILQKEPQPPRKLNPKVPVDLQTICLKAMEKDPDLRYSTAGAMAEDLRRYLNRFAILARRAGPITRLKKWVKRSPGLTAVLACLVVAIIATGFFAWRAYDAERLRLAERQQYAIDMVELEAMSGDFDEAEEAIAEAERFGASPGQVRMLKGQVALHSGDAKTAVRELQQAVGLMPESVAARALLAMAHFQNNEAGTAFGGDLKALARLEPRTAEDFLFLGHFEAMIDPQRGLTFLNEAVRLRNSPVMWLARAEARSYLAMDTGDPEDAAEAVKDAIVAKQLIPDNAAVLAVNLFAQHVEARVCRVNAPQQAHEAMVQASQDSKALEVAPLSVVWRRVMFHDYAGEKQKCLELASAARAEGNHSADHLCAVVLAEQNDYVAALDVLREDSPNGTTAWYLTMRGFVLALQPDAPDRVRAAYDQAALLPRSDMMMDLYPQTILRLLGPKHKEEALQVCRAISERRSHWPPTKKAWYMRLLDYNSGFCSAHELLNEAKGSRWSECEAHFFIAMTCLADGDHRGAREHFEAVVNTDVFSFNEHLWSRMFLARMKQDEAWPRWIDPTTIER